MNTWEGALTTKLTFLLFFGAHLNRGIEILHSEYEYAGSKDRLFEALIKKGD